MELLSQCSNWSDGEVFTFDKDNRDLAVVNAQNEGLVVVNENARQEFSVDHRSSGAGEAKNYVKIKAARIFLPNSFIM